MDACTIRIERAANGWEVEFCEPDKTTPSGSYDMAGKRTCLVYTDADKKAMLTKLATLVDEMPAPSPSKEYADAFADEARSED